MTESYERFMQRTRDEANVEIGILRAAIEIACEALRDVDANGKNERICSIANHLENVRETSAERAAKQVAERVNA